MKYLRPCLRPLTVARRSASGSWASRPPPLLPSEKTRFGARKSREGKRWAWLGTRGEGEAARSVPPTARPSTPLHRLRLVQGPLRGCGQATPRGEVHGHGHGHGARPGAASPPAAPREAPRYFPEGLPGFQGLPGGLRKGPQGLLARPFPKVASLQPRHPSLP